MPALASENLAYGNPDVGYGFAAVACSPPNLLTIMLELFNYLTELIEKVPYESWAELVK